VSSGSRAPSCHSGLPCHGSASLSFGRLCQAKSLGERTCVEGAVGLQDCHKSGREEGVLFLECLETLKSSVDASCGSGSVIAR
jgi:hypothetical protein